MKSSAQLEAIDEMLRELEDVKESHASLLEKVTQIENVHLSATGNFLQKEVTTVQEEASSNFFLLKRLIAELQTHKNSFLRSYNLEVM